MTDRGVEVVFYALLLVLPIAGLIARRPPPGRIALLVAVWIGIFVAGLLVVALVR